MRIREVREFAHKLVTGLDSLEGQVRRSATDAYRMQDLTGNEREAETRRQNDRP